MALGKWLVQKSFASFLVITRVWNHFRKRGKSRVNSSSKFNWSYARKRVVVITSGSFSPTGCLIVINCLVAKMNAYIRSVLLFKDVSCSCISAFCCWMTFEGEDFVIEEWTKNPEYLFNRVENSSKAINVGLFDSSIANKRSLIVWKCASNLVSSFSKGTALLNSAAIYFLPPFCVKRRKLPGLWYSGGTSLWLDWKRYQYCYCIERNQGEIQNSNTAIVRWPSHFG